MFDKDKINSQQMSGTASLHHRPDIDGLRAIAVLAVVAFHASKRIPGGFIGVDVFFVISGFLISSIILNGLKHDSFSFIDFYVRRIRRIFPALILVLSTSWLLGWFILEPEAYALLGKHMLAGAGFASNILLWSESGYFDPDASLKPLLHLWSLGIEEQFYLVWPVILFFAAKGRQKIYVWIVAVLAVSFAINIWGVDRDPVATFYLPLSRFWELLVGAALAYVNLNHKKTLDSYQSITAFRLSGMSVAIRDIGSVAGLLLIIASIFLLSEASSFPGWCALMPTIGALLLISAGAKAWVNRIFLSNKWMIAIGLISYPLYLWHWPLLSFGRMTAVGIDHPRLTTVSMLCLSFILSFATYRFVEKRLRYGLVLHSKIVAPALLSVLVVLAIVGTITNVQAGWIDRYPEVVRPFLNYKFDYKESFRNDRCLLSGAEQDFAAECAGTRSSAPLMLIWGDSHGAMLYRALRGTADAKGLSVAQYTSSSCPPILDFEKKDRPLCKSINDAVFKQIAVLHPATVVLAHDWPQSVAENSLDKLPQTVTKLRQAGVQRIVLVGPVPHWKQALHSEIVRSMRTKNLGAVPERMTSDTDISIKILDEKLALLAKSLLIEYVPSYRSFCNVEGCLVTLGTGKSKDLTAFDEAHLTSAAAHYLVSENSGIFFAKTN
jgi:peptidoglycan/LPS O-acetylase OafA/YrhL